MSDLLVTQPKFQQKVWHHSGWRAVVAAFMVNGLLFGVWASRVPAFKDRFELEPGMLGLLLLALAAGAITSFPMAGMLSERVGSYRLTLWCTWAYSPALIGLALSSNVVQLGVALFVFGAIHGAMDVAMNGWGAKVEEEIGRSTMPVFHAMFSLGAGLGAASGYVAVSIDMGLIAHFGFVAVAGGAIALAVMHSVQSIKRRASPAKSQQKNIALPSGAFLYLGLIAFSVAMGEGAMADWSAVYLRVESVATEAQTALGFVAFSVTMVLTRLSGAYVIERHGPVMVTRISGIIAFLGLGITTASDEFPVILSGFALVGVGYALVIPLVFSRAANDPIMLPGPAIASVAMLGYGGLLLGPPVVGFIAQLTGLRVSFVFLAVLALLATTLAHHLKPPA